MFRRKEGWFLAVRGESTKGRVARAGGPYARRGGAGDVGAHRRAAATKTQTDVCRLWRQRRLGQTAPRPGRGRARGAVPRSRFRRNPEGTEPSNHCRALMPVRNGSVHSARSAAWVLLGSVLVRWAKVARPRMRASLPLLLLDDPHRDRLRRAGFGPSLTRLVAGGLAQIRLQ